MSSTAYPRHPMRPPVRRPYTPEKPKGERQMTAVVGFPYQNGIMVCADSEITAPNGLKYSGHKIFPLDTGVCRCLFAYADQSGLATDIRNRISRQIGMLIKEPDTEIPVEDIRIAVDTVLDDRGRLYTNLPIEFL